MDRHYDNYDTYSPMTMKTNPTKAKKTKNMQTSIQAAIAVIPSTFGELVVTMLKMFINT